MEIQKAWIARIECLVERVHAGEIDLLFLDPVHPTHNTIAGKCWQIGGQKETAVIQSNSGRKRVNVVGALHATTLQPSSLVSESNCDTFMIETFLRQLREEYGNLEKPLVLILDNAKYNHGAIEQARKLNIKLDFLPPYAPNLNLIERLWKFMKKKLRHNCFYPTYQSFFDAIIAFFRNIDQYKKELESLLSLKFEIIKTN